VPVPRKLKNKKGSLSEIGGINSRLLGSPGGVELQNYFRPHRK